MSETNKPYALASDEKATPVVAYTLVGLSWGEVVTKQLVRVSTFLRTLAPDYVTLYGARSLLIGMSRPDQALVFPELHIRTPQIVAFHLLPPAEEPADYDPAEENRKMEPATVLVGPFRFDADVRMSMMVDLQKHLETAREEYLSLYNVAVSCPVMPSLGVIRTPLTLVRRDATLFSPRV